MPRTTAMEKYPEDQGYVKGSLEFATRMQLGSVAIGGDVSGGDGAATALE